MQVITKRQLRGAELFASQLADRFVTEGNKVMIVSLRAPVKFPANDQIEYFDLNLEESSRLFALEGWKRFARLISEWKPDIIQANASETLKFTISSKWLFRWRVPIVYRNANKVSDFIRSRTTRIFNSLLIRGIDHVISVSENCRIDFIDTFGVPASKTTTIPIGTLIDAGKPIYAFGNDPYWISVASFVPEKNHTGLLSIYSQYRSSGGSTPLYIVGDGKLRHILEALSSSLNIKDAVNLLGYRDDAVELIAGSQGLLLPSLIEGLPGVILEAFASRVPVIAYDVGGISEVIQHDVNGLLIARGDENLFVEAMLKLDRDPEFRNVIALRGYETCVGTYDINRIAERFFKKYQDVIKEYGDA
ncbi:MAG TPA: glycosyltransferase [Chryseolinea sp.]|nr:glycosyltransferase [Chryseolinea sp.]